VEGITDTDSLEDTLKTARRIDREDKKAIREIKNKLHEAKKAFPNDREIQGIITMFGLVGLKPKPPRKPRTRREHVKNNADKQRDYRQRQKEDGKRLRWVYDVKLDPEHRRINLVIHKGSRNICKREPDLEPCLSKVLEALDERIPPEVREDITGFFKVLGIECKPAPESMPC